MVYAEHVSNMLFIICIFFRSSSGLSRLFLQSIQNLSGLRFQINVQQRRRFLMIDFSGGLVSIREALQNPVFSPESPGFSSLIFHLAPICSRTNACEHHIL